MEKIKSFMWFAVKVYAAYVIVDVVLIFVSGWFSAAAKARPAVAANSIVGGISGQN